MASSGFSNTPHTPDFNHSIAGNLGRYRSGPKATNQAAVEHRGVDEIVPESQYWQCTGCELHHYFCWPVENPGPCDRCGSSMRSNSR
jgi:hypothetical protein